MTQNLSNPGLGGVFGSSTDLFKKFELNFAIIHKRKHVKEMVLSICALPICACYFRLFFFFCTVITIEDNSNLS